VNFSFFFLAISPVEREKVANKSYFKGVKNNHRLPVPSTLDW